jgi:CheY-like chemotaxis protein
MARVTVVNDSTDFLELMEVVLKELGHKPTGVEAQQVSIEDVARTKPELLIVDLLLNNTPQQISGWELLLLSRSHRQLREVPAILCTADVSELRKRQHDLAKLAAVHVLTKPFDMEQLAELIQPLLRQPPTDGSLPQAVVTDTAVIREDGTPPPA